MMQEIFIRRMQIEDAEAVNMLTGQLGYSIDIAQVKCNLELLLNDDDAAAFVAVLNNRVIGWMTVAGVITLESSPYCEIRGLIVDEQLRNKQIGKALIEKTKQWCRDNKRERLRVRCNVVRNASHAFYLHLGFKEKKEQKIFEMDV
ncbi:GNAT family N-acetyltransferase [Parafilimonas terrae]|uniref:Ribosomal protein S18 acetylase RimI n=1 Tax=Parafilimonas terrae TaxID=1465490 RepID=A0A1I5RPN0_9BACT|nr:GNAT family N-acetyltransferase [Parafilimonas terrae]SFP60453.1 Ribosomal protein S18 acetylase RimI [Parafilimonas terrae]